MTILTMQQLLEIDFKENPVSSVIFKDVEWFIYNDGRMTKDDFNSWHCVYVVFDGCEEIVSFRDIFGEHEVKVGEFKKSIS